MKSIKVRLPSDLFSTILWYSTTHKMTPEQFVREAIDKRIEYLIRLGAATMGVSSGDDDRGSQN